ncbi:MAG: hypothetical protein E6I46_08645 [Chloroflexi bacterium]|nr:MAG: hypothetical protein E6I46_08645 [Chloroflexota bacterium]
MARHVVVLAGGSGTRLWPRSREKSPKHLLTLHGRQSLLQSTFLRVLTSTWSPSGRRWRASASSYLNWPKRSSSSSRRGAAPPPRWGWRRLRSPSVIRRPPCSPSMRITTSVTTRTRISRRSTPRRAGPSRSVRW